MKDGNIKGFFELIYYCAKLAFYVLGAFAFAKYLDWHHFFRWL